MQWMIECLYCGSYMYRLKDKRLKCSKCHKKISLSKTNKIITLINSFINNESAHAASKRLCYSYSSIWAYYEEFRFLCAKLSEQEYELTRDQKCEYEEYFYLEKTKKNKKEAIFDAHNFLTFDYNGHIYTLLLPSLQKYKSQMIEDDLQQTYIEEFNKFKRLSRIIKVSKHHNNIVKFWDYFEKKIVQYKGIKNQQFIYFLKEFEFKYNHTQEEAKQIMISEYFKR